MDQERWKRIDQIFHSALDRDASTRASFLVEACQGDDSLRAEVEDLLASHEKEGSFFETPATDLAAEFLENQDAYKGSIAQYRILKKIGKGGMSEVYLAEDTRLHRKVALKLLPVELTKDKERIRRLEREAYAVSALNHPYILTIHDIGQIGSSTFITSEYIDGETLRQKMQKSKLPLRDILKIVSQVAEALEAAHHAGIVHRDIKPENIMIRNDGYPKVLDFGLAKLTEQKSLSQNSDFETTSKTEPGILLGTIRYMSPEQARGLYVDERSDIFSLGVVLYELLSGRAPFNGATSSDVLVEIVTKTPPPLNAYGKFPEELQWIGAKALAKDPGERYQTAKELLTDLKRVGRQLEIQQELKSLDLPVRKKKTSLAIALIILAALIGVAFLLLTRKQEKAATIQKPFSKIKLSRLTSSGLVYGGVISPDGRYIAYVQASAPGEQSLYLKQLAANTEIKIITLPLKTFFYRPRQRNNALRFSPDGEYIYYLTSPIDRDIRSLHRISVLGGISQKLIEDIDMIPSFSPDGKRLAFVKDAKDEAWIMLAQADGTLQQKIRAEKTPPAYYQDIEWSPDGKLLALIKDIEGAGASTRQIVRVSLTDFSERALFESKLKSDIWNDDLEWFSDGTGLIFTKSVEGARQIHEISMSTKESSSITNDLNDYTGVSLTRDNKSIITTQRIPNWTLWIAPSNHPNEMTQLTSGSIIEDGTRGISWNTDKKIVYESREPTGEFQLWLINPDGSDKKRITSERPIKRFPVCSPDGRYIVYTAEEEETSKLVRMDSNGGNIKVLSGTRSARWADISPDSSWLIYSTFGGKSQELLKVQMDGTSETLLASHNTLYGSAVSPDGKLIAYSYMEPQKFFGIMMNIISSKDGALLKNFSLPGDTFPGRFHWTPDGTGIAYIISAEGESNIHVQPVDGAPAYRLTNLNTEFIVNFSWSMDGKHIVYSRGKRSSDIVLIQALP